MSVQVILSGVRLVSYRNGSDRWAIEDEDGFDVGTLTLDTDRQYRLLLELASNLGVEIADRDIAEPIPDYPDDVASFVEAQAVDE